MPITISPTHLVFADQSKVTIYIVLHVCFYKRKIEKEIVCLCEREIEFEGEKEREKKKERERMIERERE